MLHCPEKNQRLDAVAFAFEKNEKKRRSHRDAVGVLVSDPAGLSLALFCRSNEAYVLDRERKKGG